MCHVCQQKNFCEIIFFVDFWNQLKKGFVQRYVSDAAPIALLDDHQPVVQITGEQQPWSVRIHIISKNPDSLMDFSTFRPTEYGSRAKKARSPE